MVNKYRDRGHCWSLFLKACIENGTLSVYPGVSGDTRAAIESLKKMIDQRVFHLQIPKDLCEFHFVHRYSSFTIFYLDVGAEIATSNTVDMVRLNYDQ